MVKVKTNHSTISLKKIQIKFQFYQQCQNLEKNESMASRAWATLGRFNTVKMAMLAVYWAVWIENRAEPESGSSQNPAFFPNPAKIFGTKIPGISHHSVFCLHSTDV